MKPQRSNLPWQYADFMARAYAIELEATERYAQFAEQLDTHNNREVAALFRRLSEIEGLHAKRILDEMQWPSMPALPPAYAWEGPWHALEIALRCEEAAKKYYDGIAASKAPAAVRKAAREMAAEEDEHVRLIREWMKKVPQPPAGWDEDPDPPRMNE
jgi:rubrerythrin